MTEPVGYTNPPNGFAPVPRGQAGTVKNPMIFLEPIARFHGPAIGTGSCVPDLYPSRKTSTMHPVYPMLKPVEKNGFRRVYLLSEGHRIVEEILFRMHLNRSGSSREETGSRTFPATIKNQE
jgi:hypothetical protein